MPEGSCIPVEGDWEHKSDTGREPVLAEPGSVIETHVDTESQPAARLEHKLDELARDYYLFTLAPIYFVTGFEHDIVRLFLQDLHISSAEYIAFVGKSRIFWCEGQWAHVVQGLPWQVVRSTMDSNNNLFKTFVISMELDRVPVKGGQREYWLIDVQTVHVPTPGVVSRRAPVDVYLPTGDTFQVSTVVRPDGLVGFQRLPADPKVRLRALEFYSRS